MKNLKFPPKKVSLLLKIAEAEKNIGKKVPDTIRSAILKTRTLQYRVVSLRVFLAGLAFALWAMSKYAPPLESVSMIAVVFSIPLIVLAAFLFAKYSLKRQRKKIFLSEKENPWLLDFGKQYEDSEENATARIECYFEKMKEEPQAKKNPILRQILAFERIVSRTFDWLCPVMFAALVALIANSVVHKIHIDTPQLSMIFGWTAGVGAVCSVILTLVVFYFSQRLNKLSAVFKVTYRTELLELGAKMDDKSEHTEDRINVGLQQIGLLK